MTDLYRFYDKNGCLLYVGISLSAVQRASEHKKEKSWWKDVNTMTVQRISEVRTEALKVEAAVIKNERPKYNAVHNRNALQNNRVEICSNPWVCQFCRQPADVIQTRNQDFVQMEEWYCCCDACDDVELPVKYSAWYAFSTKEIATPEQHLDWERHLLRKRWMDWGHWNAMVGDCRILPLADAFRVSSQEQLEWFWRFERTGVERRFPAVLLKEPF